MTRLVGTLLVTVAAIAPGQASAQRAGPGIAAESGAPPGDTVVAPDAASRGLVADSPVAPVPAAVMPAGALGRGTSHRNPVIAGALGFVVPGAGHFYAGEAGRGWAVLGVTMVGAFFALSDGAPRAAANVGSVAFVGGWIFSVVDGSLAASRYNRRHEQQSTVGGGSS